MALINGNDYDHIDFTKNGVTTRHMLKDTLSRQMSGDLVKVQNEEPTSEGTKIWIKPSGDSEVQVPTYEEFEELSDKIDDADATIASLVVGAQPTVSVTEVDGHKRFSFGIPASNGIASITKTATDGVIDTYTIAMTDGTSTSFSVNNSDITPESMAEAIATALQDYARIDGYYPDLTAGNADQLNSTKFVENKEPYLYRPSGGTSDIGNRKYLDAIIGVSLPWNQMVRDEASENQTDFADILTVTDAVEDAATLKVKIEPQQDLHGYDHPWPAGGGKNLWPYESLTMPDYNTRIYEGQYPEAFALVRNLVPGAQYRVGSTIIGDSRTFAALNVFYTDGSALYIRVSSMSGTVPDLSTGEIAISGVYIQIGTADGTGERTAKKMVLEQTSTSNPAYTPYSNICPITGWNQAKVSKTGKNILGGLELAERIQQCVPSAIIDENAKTVTFQSGKQSSGSSFDAFKDETQYTFVLTLENDYATHHATNLYVNYTDGASYSIQKSGSEKQTIVYVSLEGKTIKEFKYGSQLGTTTLYYEESGIFEGVITAEDFVSYSGNTYDIALPYEAGTVYGGEMTINEDGSGTLTVDSFSFVMNGNTETFAIPASWYAADTDRASVGFYWYFNYTGFTNFPAPKAYIMYDEIVGNWQSDRLLLDKFGAYNKDTPYIFGVPLIASYLSVRLPKSSLSDITTAEKAQASCMEWFQNNPTQFCYKIATPIAYTLTASEVRTLLGTNNIWSDTGDVALTYTGTDEHLTLESGKKYLSRINGTDSMLLGSAQEITAAKGTDNVFDLTKMFGTSVADYIYNQGAGYFRKWFGKTWYPYNTGELKHVEGLESHDVIGFNLWDEEWEIGTYNTADGTPLNRNQIRCKNLISIIPNTSYYVRTSLSGADGIWMFFYDSDKNLITDQWPTGSSAHSLNAYRFNNNVLTTSSRMYYCKFYVVASYGTTYKHDICISLVHNGSRNGEYKPYEKQSHPLDNTVILRGVPKVDSNGVCWDGDRYFPDGTVERRYGVVDLGTLDWTISDYGFYAQSPSDMISGNPRGILNAVIAEYENGYGNQVAFAQGTIDKAFIVNSTYLGGQRLYIRDSLYNDSVVFKAAMSGVLLVYELAEPTIEQALPYRNFQLVDDWGTEEFVTTGMIPVGHESRYPANLRDKLQHLPDAASSNGSYLITQTDGQMTLTPFPAPPTTAGKYALRATVTNGVATFTWEATT